MNLGIQVFDSSDRTLIASDEQIKHAFAHQKKETLFFAHWKNRDNKLPLKVIQNALGMVNFKQIFQDELRYDYICNKSSQMTQSDVHEFIDNIIVNHKLRRNTNNYDALIMIICGHGDDNNMFVTSDGKQVSIDKIRSKFDGEEMPSLKGCPKIFFVDVCRGKNIPKCQVQSTTAPIRGFTQVPLNAHRDDDFFTIWSTTKGHIVSDLSLFSSLLKSTIVAMYKTLSLDQMLRKIRTELRSTKCGEWYCIESQDTTSVEICCALSFLVNLTYVKKKKSRSIEKIGKSTLYNIENQCLESVVQVSL
ncbi:hypothetical protein RFI_12776 [Reticulomyxa filosa]|uniref:Caspase family p20 domain-containing protein n=1 Tax=Reticulomyxa filosa TaxID=46433 RepID=X6NEL2_RETFI|nr:hypothetical protein RFI_12776 [Reticulomyxa filosa]|eukprot:ETO24381.1 hypothetical protein RFI_12776 [Reticulomyxa filosa]